MRDSEAVRQHVGQSRRCQAAHLDKLNTARARLGHSPRIQREQEVRAEQDERVRTFPVTVEDAPEDDEMNVDIDVAANELFEEHHRRQQTPPPRRDPPTPSEIYDFDPRQVHGMKHPNDAGAPISKKRRLTRFEKISKLKAYRLDEAEKKFGPFKSESDWRFAEWAAKNLGQGQTNEMLELEFVSEFVRLFATSGIDVPFPQIKESDPSFHNARKLFQKIDSLPEGPGWIRDIIEVDTGYNADGSPRKEEVQLWRRDPVECIAQLIGDPAFDGHIAYGPEKTFVDDEGKTRCYSEMWTGNWWWETQVRK